MSTGGIIADTTNSSIIMTGSYGGSSDEGSGEFIHHCIIIGVPGWGGDAQPDQGQSSNNIIDGGDSNYFESGYHGRGRSIGSCGGIINNTTNSSIIMTGSNCGGSSDEGSGEFIHHCSIICVLVGGGGDAQPDPQGQSSNNIIDGGGIPTNLNVVDKEESCGVEEGGVN